MVKIVEWVEKPRVFGRFIMGKVKGEKVYIVVYDRICKDWFCTCDGFWYNKWCRHLDWLKRFVDVVEGRQMRLLRYNDIKSGDKVKKENTGIKSVDILFDGYPLSTDSLLAIYGESMAGKTILALQISAYLISKGHRVLYIDTEGGVSEIVDDWMPKFQERFGLTDKQVNDRFILAKVLDLIEFFELLGKKVKLEIKNSKVEVSINDIPQRELKNKLTLEQIIKEERIDVLVLDSMSSLFRVIPSNPQNFPARADLEAQLFYDLIKLQEKRGLFVIVLHQSTQSPMAYDSRQELRGGMVVKYFSKRIMYIDKSMKKKYWNYRRIWTIRSEDDASWSKCAVVKITDRGYEDLTPKEAVMVKNDILTDGEQKYSKVVFSFGDGDFVKVD